ncbi:unnamed protein product [Phytophthora lilii]|uniref:Unnamed protein product n=1 Tax=Phytophthora lilii TaxID=2077276 RepID=A0A9W6X8D8_9STRA|nr:unnamed protein product [Phytophthora lilii]
MTTRSSQRPSGVDFDANLTIDIIDYGTYHAYPDSWGVDECEYQSWGVQWISDHASSDVTAGKPVVMEEYGVKTLNASIYQAWSDAVYATNSNTQCWQFGVKSLSTADDGYTIYDTDELFTTVIAPAADELASRSGPSASSTASTSTASKSTATSSSTAASVAGDPSDLVDTTGSSSSATATPDASTISTTNSSSAIETATTTGLTSTSTITVTNTEASGGSSTDESTVSSTTAADKCSVHRHRA